jgi:hypothetical protein
LQAVLMFEAGRSNRQFAFGFPGFQLLDVAAPLDILNIRTQYPDTSAITLTVSANVHCGSICWLQAVLMFEAGRSNRQFAFGGGIGFTETG